MSGSEHLKLYVQELLLSYSKKCKIDLSDAETKAWLRHTLSEIDLLIHDRVRELVTAQEYQTKKASDLNNAEVEMLRSFSSRQPTIRGLFKRLLSLEGHQN